MNPVVIDTNCLLQIISRKSPYRPIWDAPRHAFPAAEPCHARRVPRDETHSGTVVSNSHPRI